MLVHFVGPDLDPNRLTLIVFLKEFFGKVNFEKISADDNKSMKITHHGMTLASRLLVSSSIKPQV